MEDLYADKKYPLKASDVHDDVNKGLPIFEKLLNNDLCATLILNYVPIRELVRSERVCRRWREVIHNYLRVCHTLCFCDVFSKNPIMVETVTNTYRIDRQISLVDSTLQLARKTLDKFSSSLVKVITERNDEEYLEIIASKCTHLRQIEILIAPECHFQLELIKKVNGLKHISLNYRYAYNRYRNHNKDRFLGTLMKNFNFEKLDIIYCDGLSGRFLNFINAQNLKSLNLTNCIELRVLDLLSAKEALRKLTSLTLDLMNPDIYETIHLLLREMWLLEELSLQSHSCWNRELNEALITAFSGLANLKRLNMRDNLAVNDALLASLAQGCTNLEYLDIRRCRIYHYDREYGGSRLTARGVEALCRRSPSAITTLHFGYIQNGENDDSFVARIINSFRLLEFESQCSVELTQHWLMDAASRGSRGRKVPIELRSGCTILQAEDVEQKLKIVLCDDLEHYKVENIF